MKTSIILENIAVVVIIVVISFTTLFFIEQKNQSKALSAFNDKQSEDLVSYHTLYSRMYEI